jgi:hypothetical protein
MKYDITKRTAHKMPKLGKGTECLQILLYKALKGMFEARFRCFSSFLAHGCATGKFSIRPQMEGVLWSNWASCSRKWGHVLKLKN